MNEDFQPGQRGSQHLDADTLTAFAEGALPPQERDAALLHLAVCGECREVAALALSPLEETLPVAVVPPRRSVGSRGFAGWRWVWGGAAACAGVVLASLVLLHPPRNGTAPGRPGAGDMAKVEAPQAPQQAPAGTPAAAAKIASPPAAAPAVRKQTVVPPAGQPALGGVAAKPIPSAGSVATEAAPEPTVAAAGGAGGKMIPDRELRDLPINSRRYSLPQEKAAAPAADPAQKAAMAPVDAPQRAAAAAASNLGAAPPPRMAAAAPAAAPSLETSQGDRAQAGIVANQVLALKLPPELPSHLTTLSRYAEGKRVLAVDSAGTVFFSKDLGRHWRAVKTVWAGRVLQVASAAEESLPQPPKPSKVPLRDDARAGNAGLQGTVRDASGAVVPGTSVTVTGMGAVLRVLTNRAGQYDLHGLAAGLYRIRAEMPGFVTQETAAMVEAGQHRTVDLALQVSSASEAVTVSADSVLDTKASAPAPVFALTTSSGERWVSADGLTWRRE